MKYFIDTEFIESGPTKPITLLSLGIAAEDGRIYYAQAIPEDPWPTPNDFVARHVFPHLSHFDMGKRVPACSASTQSCAGCPWRRLWELRADVMRFCNEKLHGTPEFWGYYADYDWVVFCQIFGAMSAPRVGGHNTATT